MQGDFSRFTFHKEKHYRLVLRQQGRVDIEADWNEQQQILRHIEETEGTDVIGPSGYPKSLPDSFALKSDATATSGLTIEAGRMYVDGILCENEAACDLFKQPDLTAVGGKLAGLTLPPAAAASFVAYLEVFFHHVTALQDPGIREKALGGPDSASRARVVWQVKLQPSKSAVCSDFVPPPPPGGTLRASTAPVASPTPCSIPPTAGFRRLENQLYRVEVHNGSDAGTPTFKWSRENASIVTGVVLISGQTITVTDLGRDDVTLGFKTAEWVELIDDRSELTDGHGTLLLVDKAAGNTVVIKPDTPVIAPVLNPGETLSSRNVRLRRWEQTGPATGPGSVAQGLAIGPGPIALEDGLQVEFQGTGYRAGDYWLIPARTAIDGDTGNIEWPAGAFLAPHGVERHYAPLAVVSYAGGGAAPTVPFQCRLPFPPLTNITASDVTVNNNTCGLPGVTTVQQQIDALCKAQSGCCALTLSPEMDWQKVLRGIKGPSASICFQVGDYVLDAPVSFGQFVSIKITGSGPGTTIRAPKSQASFIFQGCQSAEVSDLYAEAGITGGKGGPDKLKGAGVLTFQSCRSVRVTGVSLKGAEDIGLTKMTIRTSSCIEVLGAPGANTDNLQPPTTARIAHNELTVARFQEGIVVANMDRVQIEDNTLTAIPTPSVLALDRVLTNLSIRSNVRRFLFSQTTLLPSKAIPATTTAPATKPGPATTTTPTTTTPMTKTPATTAPVTTTPATTTPATATPTTTTPATTTTSPSRPETLTTTPSVVPIPAPQAPAPLAPLATSGAPVTPDAHSTLPPETPAPPAPAAGSPTGPPPPPTQANPNVPPGSNPAVHPLTRHGVTIQLNLGGGSPLQFHTPKALANVWESVLALPDLATRPGEAPKQRLTRAADTLLLNSTVRHQFPAVATWFAGIDRWWQSLPIPAAQGILVGGGKATDVRIRDNTLVGMNQGIHVGFSHANDNPNVKTATFRKTSRDMATSVAITGNTITLVGSPALRPHDGIFVGNCDSLLIQENTLTSVNQPDPTNSLCNGIRVFGFIGPLAVVANNLLRRKFRATVTFNPFARTGPTTWVHDPNPNLFP